MKRTESGYDVYHIMDLVQAIGEDGVKNILSDFSSEYKSEVHNGEIERFLRKNALDFTRKKISVTERMSGHNLMKQTLLKIEDIQRQIGGGVIFLEAEEQRELLDFYRENFFVPFAERYSDMDHVKYVQMLRLL